MLMRYTILLVVALSLVSCCAFGQSFVCPSGTCYVTGESYSGFSSMPPQVVYSTPSYGIPSGQSAYQMSAPTSVPFFAPGAGSTFASSYGSCYSSSYASESGSAYAFGYRPRLPMSYSSGYGFSPEIVSQEISPSFVTPGVESFATRERGSLFVGRGGRIRERFSSRSTRVLSPNFSPSFSVCIGRFCR